MGFCTLCSKRHPAHDKRQGGNCAACKALYVFLNAFHKRHRRKCKADKKHQPIMVERYAKLVESGQGIFE